MIRNKTIWLILGALCAILPIPGSARAADAKRYPASLCRVVWGGPYSLYYSAIRADSYLSVECPVIRDHLPGREGVPAGSTGPLAVRVDGVDSSRRSDIRCTLNVVRIDRSRVEGFVSAPVSTSGYTTWWRNSFWIEGPGETVPDDAHVSLSCLLPAWTMLGSYYVMEAD